MPAGHGINSQIVVYNLLYVWLICSAAAMGGLLFDWYTHYDRVADPTMRQAADLMISSGLADDGYQYVNLDDCWMNARNNNIPRRNGPFRDAGGNIQPNS